MYNKVILAGNLTRDIEIHYSQGGIAIGKTGIATNRKYKSQTGEQKEEVMFIDLVFFGRTAEIANQYLRKGSKVLVDGKLTLEQWTAQDGSKKSKHSVTVENLQMIGSKEENRVGGSDYPQNANTSFSSQDSYKAPTSGYNSPTSSATNPDYVKEKPVNIPVIDIDEDEIPF